MDPAQRGRLPRSGFPGLVEHSYSQDGRVNQDLRFILAGVAFDSPIRQRVRDRDLPNVWSMK